jgi:ubiquinone/menaquinone biosynthesis C-methylase UbiE
MAHMICPWWLGYFLVSPLRRLMQDPKTILQPFVADGMVVIEPGCGMGFFTIEMARLAGPRGRIVAVDVQPKMLAGLKRRARKAGVADRIDTRLADPDRLNVDDLSGKVDFALVFAVVHELPDEGRFFAELHRTLRPGGKILVAEPLGHVTPAEFHASMEAATRLGFRRTDGPIIRRSHTALLERA